MPEVNLNEQDLRLIRLALYIASGMTNIVNLRTAQEQKQAYELAQYIEEYMN